MHVKHELSLDDIIFCSKSFCVLDHELPCSTVGVDEVGNVLYRPFYTRSFSLDNGILCRYEGVRHLLAQVGNKVLALHDFERCSAAMFLFGRMTADALCSVLIAGCAMQEFP